MLNKIKILLSIAFLINLLISETFTGYVREIEASFCMDECAHFYLESESSVHITNISFGEIEPTLYINRFVEIEGDEIWCVECGAVEIDQIILLANCENPVFCFADPCEVAPDCQINTPVECISNYCGGCHADFYDLTGNLVDCLNEVSCNDIAAQYESLHTGEYSICEYDNDCIAVWGHCDVGLGGCHYSVNEESYPEEEINDFVDMWNDGDCMSWVCDCSAEPYAQCISETCTSAYCMSPNPAGCFQTGCDEGYECIVVPNDCVPSWCGCDGFYGDWICTEDCGGGTCAPIDFLLNGDVNYDGQLNISDIVLMVNMILGILDIDLNADMNEDNSIDIIDVVSLINIILSGN